MASESGKDGVPASKRLKLGLVLYTGPSTSHFSLGIELAKAALRSGYDVDMFAWGDAVYGTKTVDQVPPAAEPAVSEVLRLAGAMDKGEPALSLRVCTSCCKTRDISQERLLPGVRLGGTHNIVGMLQECDRTVVLVP